MRGWGLGLDARAGTRTPTTILKMYIIQNQLIFNWCYIMLEPFRVGGLLKLQFLRPRYGVLRIPIVIVFAQKACAMKLFPLRIIIK